jgi:nucleotide-binding universal stress UspA family protein
MFTRILCAVDLSDAAPAILRHAAGLASAANASLVVVHVTTGDDGSLETARAAIEREFMRAVPYEASYATANDIRIVRGERAAGIVAEAARIDADLIVMGTRGRGNLAGWLMGSTSRLIMEATTVPVFLVPNTTSDIVTLGADHALLNFGPVIAAIDLEEHNDAQIAVASEMAALAHERLLLLTVVPDRPGSVGDATAALRVRAHGVRPLRPHLLVVRHGDVARQIAGAAMTEGAGLVVMGLRHPGSGSRPGRIASAVLETKRSFILVVPDLANAGSRTDHRVEREPADDFLDTVALLPGPGERYRSLPLTGRAGHRPPLSGVRKITRSSGNLPARTRELRAISR